MGVPRREQPERGQQQRQYQVRSGACRVRAPGWRAGCPGDRGRTSTFLPGKSSGAVWGVGWWGETVLSPPQVPLGVPLVP